MANSLGLPVYPPFKQSENAITVSDIHHACSPIYTIEKTDILEVADFLGGTCSQTSQSEKTRIFGLEEWILFIQIISSYKSQRLVFPMYCAYRHVTIGEYQWFGAVARQHKPKSRQVSVVLNYTSKFNVENSRRHSTTVNYAK